MYCPQCGKPLPDGAAACVACGAALESEGPPQAAAVPAEKGAAEAGAKTKAIARTMVGISASELLPKGLSAAQPAKASAANRTIVGLAAADLAAPAARAPAAGGDAGAGAGGADRALGATRVVGTPAALSGGAPAPKTADGTLLGTPALKGTAAAAGAPQVSAPDAASGTLLGVARPGIAPLAPGSDEAADEPAPPARDDRADAGADDEPRELGATLVPRRAPVKQAAKRAHIDLRRAGAHARIPGVPGVPGARREEPRKEPGRARASKQALWLAIAGGALALFAVLFVVFWPDPPPVTAQARVDAGGRDVLEVRCPTCPDGTVVSIAEARATVAGGVAQVPLAAPLSVGENRMKVAIDRPGRGRDETIGISANVAYRIAPDLSTLQGERPSIQVVVEAMNGTEVLLDGKVLPLSGGRAVEVIDAGEAILGPADDARTLARQVPYAVTPPQGPREQGVVSVSVGIVPLRIDAPGPSVVIEKESFVLEGRTAKGAKIFAGPHPIPVRPDGTFAHVMNVSSVGSTQFEVRAKMEGMAPRIVKIAVRRVDRLEAAAKEFAAQKPIGWADLLGGPKANVGKAVAIEGEVLEARRQGHATMLLLRAPASAGCRAGGGCSARLIYGVQLAAQQGDTVAAYGRVAPPFAAEGGAEVPEVQVEFAIKK